MAVRYVSEIRITHYVDADNVRCFRFEACRPSDIVPMHDALFAANNNKCFYIDVTTYVQYFGFIKCRKNVFQLNSDSDYQIIQEFLKPFQNRH